MVKQQDLSIAKTHDCKGISKPSARASKINASTAFDTCREQLSPFGGLLAFCVQYFYTPQQNQTGIVFTKI